MVSIRQARCSTSAAVLAMTATPGCLQQWQVSRVCCSERSIMHVIWPVKTKCSTLHSHCMVHVESHQRLKNAVTGDVHHHIGVDSVVGPPCCWAGVQLALQQPACWRPCRCVAWAEEGHAVRHAAARLHGSTAVRLPGCRPGPRCRQHTL